MVGDGSAEVEDRHRLRVELRKLPPRQRAVIVLRFYDDRSDAATVRTRDGYVYLTALVAGKIVSQPVQLTVELVDEAVERLPIHLWRFNDRTAPLHIRTVLRPISDPEPGVPAIRACKRSAE